MNVRPIRVLLVDDDEVDREALERGFRECAIPVAVIGARNGREALRVLRGAAPGGAIARPCIILLDLNMPQMDGFAFLDHLRSDASLRDHIVFVVTTSNRDADRTAAYRRNVAGYITKSSVGESCVELVRLIDAYWRVVALPA